MFLQCICYASENEKTKILFCLWFQNRCFLDFLTFNLISHFRQCLIFFTDIIIGFRKLHWSGERDFRLTRKTFLARCTLSTTYTCVNWTEATSDRFNILRLL